MPQGVQRSHEDQLANLQRHGHERCHHLPKLELGFNGVSLCWVLRLHPSPLCYLFPIRLPGGAGEKFGDRHYPRWCTHHTGWALQQCQGLRCLEPGALSAMHGWKRDSIRLGGAPVETPSGSCGIIPGTFSSRPCGWAEVWLFLQWAAYTSQGNGSLPESQHQ